MYRISFSRLVYVTMLLFSISDAFAANFNIAPYGVMPTAVHRGETVSAYFTVTNLTSTSRNGYTVEKLPATVTQNTTPPNCSNPINLGPNASCQLQLDITGAVSARVGVCKGSSCTRAATRLNVTESLMPRFAYVTENLGPPVLVCPVDPSTGGLVGAQCVSAGGGLSAVSPQGIQISNDGHTAYITAPAQGLDSYAYQCSIVSTTGQFSGCTGTLITSPAYYVANLGFLTLNTSNNLAYLVNEEGVIACSISGNTIQGNCVDTGLVGSNGPWVGIALNTANNIAYVGTYGNATVTTCGVSGATFNMCGSKTGDGVISFALPIGVMLNRAGTILYISDFGNQVVYGCDAISSAETSSTTFNHCFIATSGLSGFYPWGITLNTANTVAYVTDSQSQVYTCGILPDGRFSTCVPTTGYVFDEPNEVALLY
jgi:hypothetical protein